MAASPALLEVLGEGGRLASALPGWEPREAQLEMASAVETALRERRPLLVEAGTGTGKTLGYLVPALLSGLKVVVSTGTKNLQEQILRKDVPLLAAHLPVPFTATVLKGISNYLCLRRFKDHVAAQHAAGLLVGGGASAADQEGAQEDDAAAALEALAAWADRTATGDRGELPDLPDDSPLWREVSATAETRLGPRCPFHDRCFVTRARRAAQAADLIIVNHHLFFADLSLRDRWPSAQLLPSYEAVIFDEAHQLEDVATDYFGVSLSSLRTARLAHDVEAAVAMSHLDERGADTARHLRACADDLFAALRPRLPRDARATATPELWSGEPSRAFRELDTALEALEGLAAGTPTDTTESAERCAALARRARSARDDLALLADQTDRGKVYWAETRGRTVLIGASPVDVAEPLRSALLGQVDTAVFTSATLTMGGRFDYVRERLGLEAAAELRVDSPFDYREQALLYLPRDLPEPAAPAFAQAAAEQILPLVEASGGRAFLLFTSHRMMQGMHARLAHRIAALQHQVLLQGSEPRHLLLERFKERPSVLFATGAFWEGVDVVGDALQLVVIDKLPFAPPDDPLVAARARRIEEEGRSGFSEYQVPQAALALAQGFGRLIRHRGDRGVVAILDVRASLRPYGARVLSALPRDCPRTADLAAVCAFLRELRSDGSDGAARATHGGARGLPGFDPPVV